MPRHARIHLINAFEGPARRLEDNIHAMRRCAVGFLAHNPAVVLEGHYVVQVGLGVAFEDHFNNVGVVVVEVPAAALARCHSKQMSHA